MAYAVQSWTDTVTPVDKAHMDHIESGIATADTNATTALGRVQVPTVVNGQFVKGVGGAAVWAALTPADSGLPKITAQTLATGPPGSPADGDIWIANSVDALGTVWQFRYNAGSASAYKWEFIGGGPLSAAVPTAESIPAGSGIVDAATVGPQITLVRGGDYWISTYCQMNASTPAGATPYAGTLVCNPTAAAGPEADCQAVTNAYATPHGEGPVNGMVAATILRLRYFNSNGNAALIQTRRISAWPIRIS